MTEAHWLTGQHVWPLFEFAESRLSDRKARLFALACCRRVWHYLTDERSRRAVETSELCVEGLCSSHEQERVAQEAFQVQLDGIGIAGMNRTIHSAAFAAFCSLDANELYRRQAHDAALQTATDGAGYPPLASNENVRQAARNAELAAQANLLRDVLGNPFRPVTISPSWRTDTAITLAKQMYESREFSAMPILADALQDAGCEDEQILNHCRDSNQVHVRGCFVVDLVLGKE